MHYYEVKGDTERLVAVGPGSDVSLVSLDGVVRELRSCGRVQVITYGHAFNGPRRTLCGACAQAAESLGRTEHGMHSGRCEGLRYADTNRSSKWWAQ